MAVWCNSEDIAQDSHISYQSTRIGVPVPLVMVNSQVSAHWKAANDGPSGWVSVTPGGEPECILVSWLQSGPSPDPHGHGKEEPTDRKTSVSLSLCPSNK